MKTKYVTFVNEYGADDIIIFTNMQSHDNMDHVATEILGAGFLYITTDEDGKVDVHCYGKSDSLDVESRGLKDAAIAQRALDIG